MTSEKHGLPALISIFIPGLGQIIKGHFFKGFMIWVIGGLVSFFLWWTVIIPLFVWLWNVYDAYNA
jgi:TM2 domain-containing membrane protein YozV